ncbi:MAG: putative N-acetylmannosamine-6-phosphate 2-epimerase, partial [bacterium]
MEASRILGQLKDRLIVSCQARKGEPFRNSQSIRAFAECARLAGAAGVRANGVKDIRAIRKIFKGIIIGIEKTVCKGFDVFITPSLESCLRIAATGCEIVALDGTQRPRPDGRTLEQTIAELKKKFPAVLVMADCSTVQEGLAAADAGADIIATTLSGYTAYTTYRTDKTHNSGPDVEMVRELATRQKKPVFAEGRIRNEADLRAIVEAGAYSVVIGSAITRPLHLAQKFTTAYGNFVALRKKNLAVAVDIGGSNIRIALVDRGGQIRAQRRFTQKSASSPQAALGRLARLVAEFARKSPRSRLCGVGVCTGGIVDPIS